MNKLYHYTNQRRKLIIWVLLMSFHWLASASEPLLRFERLTIDHGLSQISVEAIIHDHKGYLWLATHDGLNRYDGYEFKHFHHDPHDPNSLSNSSITTLYQDSQGTLWIGTKVGLSRYNAKQQNFDRYYHHSDDSQSLSHNYVTSIFEDDQQQLWIGTQGGGLNRFDNNQFSHYTHSLTDSSSLGHNQVKAIIQDDQGYLWVGTQNGLSRFDSHNGVFKTYKYQADNPNGLSHNQITGLIKDPRGFIWISTHGGGLNRLDPINEEFRQFTPDHGNTKQHSLNKLTAMSQMDKGIIWLGTEGQGLIRFDSHALHFEHFKNQPADPNSLSHNFIRSIYQDHNGLLWIGTWGGGVNLLSNKPRHFGHFKHQIDNPFSLSNNTVGAIFVDSNDTLWIGTWGDGLNRQRPGENTFEHLKHQTNNANSLSDNNIWSINQDSEQNLWIGTKGGLNRYDQSNDVFIHYRHQPNNPNSLSHDWVVAIVEDPQDNLWIGTRGGGLNRFDNTNQSFSHFRHQPQNNNSLSSDQILTLSPSSNGTLWIGTSDAGLNQFDPRTERFKRYRHDPSNPDSLSSNFVISTYVDSKGILWVGTLGGGLNRYSANYDKFIHFSQADGLPNNTVYAITEDAQYNLWLSTNNGLAKFNIQTGQFKHFDVKDGLQSNEFNSNAYFRDRDGELFFGGTNGFNRFYPQHIIENSRPPKVVLTDFLLFNQSVKIGPSKHKNNNPTHTQPFKLNEAIEYLPELTIGHKENLVTFEFVAFDYSNPMKNQYAYRLEGQDAAWIYTDAKSRRATYTNLLPGEYTLRIKASNSDGYWNEQGKSLKLTVKPPPWKTWWAYGLYLVLLVGLVLRQVLKQRQKIRDHQEVNQRLKQVDRLKDEFLANTSHELRTPLNGIIGLAESLIDGVAGELPDEANRNLAMVVSSGKRLSHLINDVLDFSKLKNHSLTIHPKPVDLYSMVEVVVTLSRPLLANKKLELINGVSKTLPPVMADENRLEQILHNLVSNGIKFTDSGLVTVTARKKGQNLIISVIDTGIGIDKKHFATLFESFEQVENDSHLHHSGTGLGLSISKQLVELHGGQLRLRSELGAGSNFNFSLPISKLPAEPDSVANQLVSRLHCYDESSIVLEPAHSSKGDNNQNCRILVVDDEAINRQVLYNHLSLHNYQLTEASSGQQALDVINQQAPFDLVLLDIMMPHLSGYEVCSILRESYSRNDLPIIFLTAKNQVADMVESFTVGANDHLSKPISKVELLIRVETHLKFLDIHRNLESKITERTMMLEQKHQELAQKHQELEQKNKAIVDTQQQLVQAEKMASLGILTAGVAHEINNPNNFVHVSSQNLEADLVKTQQFFIDLAGDEADDEILDSFSQQFSPLTHHIETIKDGSLRIKTIVQDLRTFTQLDRAEQQSAKPTELLQATVNLVRSRYLKTIDFNLQFAHTPAIECHPARLNQVFMNLLVNSCQAIEAQANQEQKGLITISCKVVAQHIQIEISDNGCGMSKQTQQRLFEPFYTTKAVGEGTGLGLSISFGIIQQHQGSIEVSSTVAQGTTFTLCLPMTIDR